jgi:NCAIR mutase (PurE)-related protein
MDNQKLIELLTNLQNNSISVIQVVDQLKDLPFEDLGFAKIDHHRSIRKGFPEVIFCQNKTIAQIIAIAQSQIKHNETILGTRANQETLDAVAKSIPGIEFDPLARCFWKKSEYWAINQNVRGSVLICAAGTADLPVALEAQRTLEIFGHPCTMLSDVGIAGIHRLFSYKDLLNDAKVIIAVAGMEGALPSVIAGYVSCPVIGVPTSVGYGSHLNGMVPLLAMLNSCASGLSVVNIDNGFGAAYAAATINAM